MLKRISIIGIILMSLLLCTACATSKNEEKTKVSGEDQTKVEQKEVIEDILGNKIELDKPYDKVMILGSGSGGPLTTMIALDKDSFASKIIAMDDGLKLNRNDLWQRLLKSVPDLENVELVGEVNKNGLSSEYLLKLNPDAIIAPIMYQAKIDELSKKTGIQVVYIDYHAQDLDTHLKSTEIISKVTGLNKNLDPLKNFYAEKVGNVIDKASKITEKPLVYVETGYPGPNEYYNTYGNNKMWGKIITDAGGHNIAGDILDVEDARPINEESVLKSNPEIIIITGSTWEKMPESMKLGFDVKKDQSLSILKKYTERDGWNQLDAIKNKKLYAIGHLMCRDMTDFYSYEKLAKLFHPEVFKDIDPEKDIKEYYEKFMPIEFEGTWFVEYE